MYQAHISRDAEPLNLIRPEVPAELAALVAKLMAKDPKRRFQTPGEAAEALRPFLRARPAPAAAAARRPGGRPRPARPGPGRPIAAPPSAPAADSAPAQPWNTLIDFGAAEPIAPPKPAASTTPRRLRPPTIKQAVAGVVVLAGLLAVWAASSVRARTANGLIILDDIPADARVEVDHGTLTIARDGDQATITEVPVGQEYRIMVVKGDATLWAEAVTVRVGGMPVRLSYKPIGKDVGPVATSPSDEPAAVPTAPSPAATATDRSPNPRTVARLASRRKSARGNGRSPAMNCSSPNWSQNRGSGPATRSCSASVTGRTMTSKWKPTKRREPIILAWFPGPVRPRFPGPPVGLLCQQGVRANP